MPRILSLAYELEILQLLHIILLRAGYEHHYTTDPQQALKLLQSQSFDLLTQDLHRPTLNGAEFYALLQQDNTLRHLPVLIISSLNPFSLPPTYTRLIADLYPHHYVTVPFAPKQIVAAVKGILIEPAASIHNLITANSSPTQLLCRA